MRHHPLPLNFSTSLITSCTSLPKRSCSKSARTRTGENYVQLSGLVSQNAGLGEVRRSCRGTSSVALIRRFNQWALEERNKQLKQEKKKRVKRSQGRHHITLYLDYCDMFFKKVKEAKEELGSEEVTATKISRPRP